MFVKVISWNCDPTSSKVLAKELVFRKAALPITSSKLFHSHFSWIYRGPIFQNTSQWMFSFLFMFLQLITFKTNFLVSLSWRDQIIHYKQSSSKTINSSISNQSFQFFFTLYFKQIFYAPPNYANFQSYCSFHLISEGFKLCYWKTRNELQRERKGKQ